MILPAESVIQFFSVSEHFIKHGAVKTEPFLAQSLIEFLVSSSN